MDELSSQSGDQAWQDMATFVNSLTAHLSQNERTANLVTKLRSTIGSSSKELSDFEAILADLNQNVDFQAALNDYIVQLYSHLDAESDFGKSDQTAQMQMRKGEAHLKQEEFESAITAFSLALVNADTAKHNNKPATPANILNARAVAFLKFEQPYECVLDLLEALRLTKGDMPPSAYFRLAEASLTGFTEEHQAKLQHVLQLLRDCMNGQSCAQIPENAISKLQTYIEKLEKLATDLSVGGSNAAEDNSADSELIQTIELKESNPTIPGASAKVIVEHDDLKGRFFVAQQAIENGETLFVEEPFAFYSTDEFLCCNCLRSLASIRADTDPEQQQDSAEIAVHCSFVSCPTCRRANFCDDKCRTEACHRFHAAECATRMFALEQQIGIAYIVMRTLFSAGGPARALEHYQTFKSESNDSNVDKHTDKYQTILSLMTHAKEHDDNTNTCYVLMTFVLAHLLRRHIPDFEQSSDSNSLSILCLLLHHLQQMSTNLVTIFQQDMVAEPNSVPSLTSELSQMPTKETPIGTAFYATIALLNHSCDPDLLPLYQDSRLILKATRSIAPGREVNFCYGPTYMKMSYGQRQKSLSDQYFFSCHCSACNEKKENYGNAYLCCICNGPAFLIQNQLYCSRQADHVNANVEPILAALKQASMQLKAGDTFLEQFNRKDDSADIVAALVSYSKADVTYSGHLFALNSSLVRVKRQLINCYLKMGHFDRADIYSCQLIRVFQRYLNQTDVALSLLQEQLRLIKILALRIEESIEEDGPRSNVAVELRTRMETTLDDFKHTLDTFKTKQNEEQFEQSFDKEHEFLQEKRCWLKELSTAN